MEENQISRMALWAAYTRAYHAKHDAPMIFDDFLAHHFITEKDNAYFEQQIQKLLTLVQSNAPALFTSFPDQAAAMAWVMHPG